MSRLSAFTLALLLPWAAATAQGLHVSAEPGSAVLGETSEVRLTVTRGASGAPLRAHASVGSLEPLDDREGERVRWRWTPPPERFPRTALLLFWEEAARPPSLALVKLPLIGRIELSVDTEPHAQVRVEVGAAQFGPARADASGKARVTVEVGPQSRQARVLAESQGARTTRTVALDVPQSSSLTATLLSDEVSSDEGGWLVLAHAERLEPATLSLQTRGARLALVRSGSDLAVYRVLPDESPDDVQLEIRSTEPGVEPLTLSARKVGRSERRSAAQEPAPEGVPLSFFLGAGGFWAGGENLGPALELGLGYSFPAFARRLHLELALGFRSSGARFPVDGLGALDGSLQAVPITLGARMRTWSVGRFHVDARAGMGGLLFRHRLTSDFQPAFQEGGVKPELYGGAQLATAVGPFEGYAEVRGIWARVRAEQLQANAGGAAGLVGLRYLLP